MTVTELRSSADRGNRDGDIYIFSCLASREIASCLVQLSPSIALRSDSLTVCSQSGTSR